ncbi:MAG TPA: DUF1839 family protein [Polyangiaceae bacterium]|nr:DUF1839 family protein [Polyangiaceae bacterium]
MSVVSAWNLDATSYARSPLHGESALWIEKNCYIDVWIEGLHAAKLDPIAALPFTLATDFEGDQWTFFKPSHADLATLYGVVVQELNVWKPLLEHALYHVAKGRLIFTEADAHWLPDTSGTDYRTNHVKSTIAIETVDLERRKLGYFHNASYYTLEGEDFARTFRLDMPPDPTFMPFFAELARFDRVERLPSTELAARSRALLPGWYARRPEQNPIVAFGDAFVRDLEGLKDQGIATYHAYAFATVRQCGACFELSAEYLRWLGRELGTEWAAPATHFDAISNGAKALIMKAARAVVGKKTVDFKPLFAELAGHWDNGMAELGALVRG